MKNKEVLGTSLNEKESIFNKYGIFFFYLKYDETSFFSLENFSSAPLTVFTPLRN